MQTTSAKSNAHFSPYQYGDKVMQEQSGLDTALAGAMDQSALMDNLLKRRNTLLDGLEVNQCDSISFSLPFLFPLLSFYFIYT